MPIFCQVNLKSLVSQFVPKCRSDVSDSLWRRQSLVYLMSDSYVIHSEGLSSMMQFQFLIMACDLVRVSFSKMCYLIVIDTVRLLIRTCSDVSRRGQQFDHTGWCCSRFVLFIRRIRVSAGCFRPQISRRQLHRVANHPIVDCSAYIGKHSFDFDGTSAFVQSPQPDYCCEIS